MKLFSVKEVEIKKTENQQVRESRFLADLIKGKQATLTELQRKDLQERQRIEDEFQHFATNIVEKRTALLKEVGELERRKEEALVPIDKLTYELSVREQVLSEKEKNFKVKDFKVSQEKEKLVEELMFVADKKDELAEREQALVRKEEQIKEQQTMLTNQTIDLNTKWQEYHLVFKEKEQGLKAEALRNTNEAQVNETIRQQLEKDHRQNELDRRAIKDGYDNLEKARTEILGRTD